jgi:hypothetical protein
MKKRVYLDSFFQQSKVVPKKVKQPTRVLGERIGDMGKPLVDGDGDGKCRERGNRYVPCPPGVRAGTRLRNGVPLKPKRTDLRPGGGIDHKSLIPATHWKKIEDKLKEIGISEEDLLRATREGLKRADPKSKALSKKWYRLVNSQVKKFVKDHNAKHGTSLKEEQVAGVIAALSPLREFKKNMIDAKKLLDVISEDKPFTIPQSLMDTFKRDREALQKIIDRSNGDLRPSSFRNDELDILVAVNSALSEVAGPTGFLNVVKATLIARGEPNEEVLGGPKVRSFYSNIIDPDGERATIDTWMYRIMVPKDLKIKYKDGLATTKEIEKMDGKLQNIFQGAPTDNKIGIPNHVGLYPMFAQVIRQVAEENDLSPAALQAILWEVARTDAGEKPTQWENILKEFVA